MAADKRRQSALDEASQDLAAARRQLEDAVDHARSEGSRHANRIREAIDDDVADSPWDNIKDWYDANAGWIKTVTKVLSYVAAALAGGGSVHPRPERSRLLAHRRGPTQPRDSRRQRERFVGRRRPDRLRLGHDGRRPAGDRWVAGLRWVAWRPSCDPRCRVTRSSRGGHVERHAIEPSRSHRRGQDPFPPDRQRGPAPRRPADHRRGQDRCTASRDSGRAGSPRCPAGSYHLRGEGAGGGSGCGSVPQRHHKPEIKVPPGDAGVQQASRNADLLRNTNAGATHSGIGVDAADKFGEDSGLVEPYKEAKGHYKHEVGSTW